MPCNRRQFITRAGTAAAVTTVATQAAHAAAAAPRVDTHLHCFAGNSKQFPYHARAPYRPTQAASPEHLLHCMDGAGVQSAVVVHPEPYQDDHRYLAHCLTVGQGRLKGTLLLFADRAQSLEKMTSLVQQLPIIAVRVHAYAPDRLPPFGQPELRRLWQLASDLRIAVQLHFEPRYASGFEPLLRAFPGTRVIVDHLGRPFQGTPQEHARVRDWSKFPQVIMKLSSIPAREQYPHRDIGPTIRELTLAYGADRMLYGGGFSANATPASYRAAFDRARAYLTHMSAADQDKILGGTAARLFFSSPG